MLSRNFKQIHFFEDVFGRLTVKILGSRYATFIEQLI